MKYSIIFDTDSYKASHYLQYPPGTTGIFSYIESRGGEYEKTLFFGLQYYLKEYLTQKITSIEVEKANKFFIAHGEPFNYDGWMYIAEKLNGKLPIRIRSLPEGTILPTHNALVTVESTNDNVPWITSWIETSLLRNCWYATTVATRSFIIKQIIMSALVKSSDNPESEIAFKLHDFGSRGVSSQESAMLGGAAHLVNFMGSDTVVGVLCANQYYDIDMAGFSIPASEHSSITSWGKENEVKAYRNMLAKFGKPKSLVACVSDSYDLWNACEKLWGDSLRQEIIDCQAVVIIRPDAGHPSDVVLKTAQILDSKFGSVLNSKGFKVLNHVRIIQGDGINERSIKEILNHLMNHGYSATNVTFGMGGQLLQQLHRDTLKFAMKCSSITLNGLEERDVFKDPITDFGKRSKAGRLDLIIDELDKYQTVRLLPGEISRPQSVMRTVYENGELLINDKFEDVRNRTRFHFLNNAG